MVMQMPVITAVVVAAEDLELVVVIQELEPLELFGAVVLVSEHFHQQIQVSHTQILALANSINSPKRFPL
jgi:hypothetical protein